MKLRFFFVESDTVAASRSRSRAGGLETAEALNQTAGKQDLRLITAET
jgi:hypothetical protein